MFSFSIPAHLDRPKNDYLITREIQNQPWKRKFNSEMSKAQYKLIM